MNKMICPYLGQKDDPATALDFPSAGNYCHHAKPVTQVNGTHQQQYCLVAEHINCPFFQAASGIPLPEPMAAANESTQPPFRRALAILAIPVLLVSAVALALNNVSINNRTLPYRAIADTSGGLAPPTAWALLNPQPVNTPTASEPQAVSVQPLVANCLLPAEWVPYIVSPTDSLYRLSVIYDVSVDELLQQNCLGDKATIFPGQVIFVPNNLTGPAIPISLQSAPIPVSANHSSSPGSPKTTPIPPSSTNPPPTTGPNNQPTDPPPSSDPTSSPTKKKPKSKPGGNGHKNGKGNGNGNGHGNGKGK
jgi:LysM repeat protein